LRTCQNLTFEQKKTKKNQASEKLIYFSVLRTQQNPTFRVRKPRKNRERIKAKAEKKQRQNKERTRKRGAFAR
jgi:hypothetical protein